MRIEKTYLRSGGSWNLASEKRFVWDKNNIVAELNASDVVVKTHVWGLDIVGSLTKSGGVGALLATSDGTMTNYPFYDANGNITAYVDSADNINWTCVYNPFGVEKETTGTKPCEFGFSTKYTSYGIVHYRYRKYIPLYARFINRDPIEEKGGINLYAFVENNPVNNWDYLGHLSYYNALYHWWFGGGIDYPVAFNEVDPGMSQSDFSGYSDLVSSACSDQADKQVELVQTFGTGASSTYDSPIGPS